MTNMLINKSGKQSHSYLEINLTKKGEDLYKENLETLK